MSNSDDFDDDAPDLPRLPDDAPEEDRGAKGRFVGTGKAGGRPSKGNREKHGLGALRSLVRSYLARGDEPLAMNEIDGRTRAGKAVIELRRDLIDDLGGQDQVTTTQKMLVDLVVTDQVFVGSLDAALQAYVLAGGDITDTDKHGRLSVAPIIRERAYLADSMTRRMDALGLERRPSTDPNVARVLELARKYGQKGAAAAQGAPAKPKKDEPGTEE